MTFILAAEEKKEEKSSVIPIYLTFKIGEHFHHFLQDTSKQLTVSKRCGTDLSKNSASYRKCQAIQAIFKVSKKDLKEIDLYGGKNIGSVLCSKSAKGKVIFGKNFYRESRTFCQFQDDSIIATDTLAYYGEVNAKFK
jgi:hypothetical protein